MADFSVTHTAPYGVQAYTMASTRPRGQGEAASFDPASPTAASEPSGDQVFISREGRNLSTNQNTPQAPEQGDNKPADTKQQESKGNAREPLDAEEVRQLQELKSRDIEVRAHEQAHMSAAGQYAAGGPSFSYQTGADGKRYAIGGSVPIDVGKESKPEATIAKMRTVKRAALAPANPSPADRQIAAQAGMQELEARQELQTSQMTKIQAAPTASPVESKPEVTENRGENQASTASSSMASLKEPSTTIRTRMNSAYKAMASLA